MGPASELALFIGGSTSLGSRSSSSRTQAGQAEVARWKLSISANSRRRYGIVVVTVTTEPSAKATVTEKLVPFLKGDGL